MEIVDPPKKPDNVAADVLLRVTHKTIPNAGGLYLWIGLPYLSSENQWLCEEHVEGFAQRKAPGTSSLLALSFALSLARQDLEVLWLEGYEFSIPNNDKLSHNRGVLTAVFGMHRFEPVEVFREMYGY